MKNLKINNTHTTSAMHKELVIVFVKNVILGKVKTRLAKTIGNQAAFEVYKELIKVTENATSKLDADVWIYYSETIVETKWEDQHKMVQHGKDLGERMQNAFDDAFTKGYDRVVLIGSDLPNLMAQHITNGLEALQKTEVTFGPALDGGYYLIGQTKNHECIFKNKPWSQPELLEITLTELKKQNVSFTLLEPQNDIDTYDDLIASNFYQKNKELQEKISQLNA